MKLQASGVLRAWVHPSLVVALEKLTDRVVKEGLSLELSQHLMVMSSSLSIRLEQCLFIRLHPHRTVDLQLPLAQHKLGLLRYFTRLGFPWFDLPFFCFTFLPFSSPETQAFELKF